MLTDIISHGEAEPDDRAMLGALFYFLGFINITLLGVSCEFGGIVAIRVGRG